MSNAAKKSKKLMAPINPTTSASEVTEMIPLFTNMTCASESGSSSWEVMYRLFEDEKPHRVEREAIADAIGSS